MRSPALDIRELLNSVSSLALTEGTDLFCYRLPSAPQDCVAVLDNPSRGAYLTYNKTTSNLFNVSVTVYVRDHDYADGYALSLAIMRYLHGSHQVVIDTTLYCLMKALTDPQLLHWDENDRAVFVTSYDLVRRDN